MSVTWLGDDHYQQRGSDEHQKFGAGLVYDHIIMKSTIMY